MGHPSKRQGSLNVGLTVSSNGSQRSTAGRVPLAGTSQQEAIWTELVNGESNVEVQALAGTGKSTTAREGIHRIKEAGRKGSIAYAVFNKHVAAEFQKSLPPGAIAGTLHALGFKMLKSKLGNVSIEQYKVDRLAEKYFPGRWDQKTERMAVVKLVGLCKSHLISGEESADLLDFAASHDIDLGRNNRDVLAVVPEVLEECRQQTDVIDFDDMVWLPVALDLTPARPFDFLFVDESQDLNFGQHALVRALCPTGRIVSIGDPNQAIYAFRGADSNSMDTLATWLSTSERGLSKFPLTVTWRCPKSHVELARKIVPGLEAAPNAIEGEIDVLNEGQAMEALRPGDMAICRNNAPLISACFGQIRRGVKAVVRGRDIGKGLLTLMARMKANTILELIGKLDDYRVREIANISQLRHPEQALASLNDRVECLLALCSECPSIDSIKSKIETLFSDDDESNAVVFSTVHRAKGLERSSITLLRTDLLPHPACRTSVAQRQEMNLLYVALTRATRRLTFVGQKPEPLTRHDAGSGITKEMIARAIEARGFDPLRDCSPLD